MLCIFIFILNIFKSSEQYFGNNGYNMNPGFGLVSKKMVTVSYKLKNIAYLWTNFYVVITTKE